MRARRSPSCSQGASAAITSAFAGTPFGKRARSRASRSTAAAAAPRRRDPAPAPCALLVVARETPAACLPPALDERARRRLGEEAAAAREVPATPCALLRCAPRPAGVLNSRPHSGQSSQPQGQREGTRTLAHYRPCPQVRASGTTNLRTLTPSFGSASISLSG